MAYPTVDELNRAIEENNHKQIRDWFHNFPVVAGSLAQSVSFRLKLLMPEVEKGTDLRQLSWAIGWGRK